MLENKKNQMNEEDLPKPESLKKQNKKMSGLFIVFIICLVLMAITANMSGDLMEGIWMLSVVGVIVTGVIYAVKNFKHKK